MAITVQQIEAVPQDYPVVIGPSGPRGFAAWAWQRVESYTAQRYTARQVTWTIEGEGDWTPPLVPAVVTLAEKWEATEWVEVNLPLGPYGHFLPGEGPYRITATVGGGDVPEAVSEAVRRLIAYSTEIGTNADGFTAVQDGEVSFERAATWAARALQNSGAADLLRPYRRA